MGASSPHRSMSLTTGTQSSGYKACITAGELEMNLCRQSLDSLEDCLFEVLFQMRTD